MQPSETQDALQRVLSYLYWLGVDVTPELEKQALVLLAKAIDTGEADLIPVCMELLPEHFDTPQLTYPPLAPKINRGSIGYGEY